MHSLMELCWFIIAVALETTGEGKLIYFEDIIALQHKKNPLEKKLQNTELPYEFRDWVI